mgnify:CR=1 FL=1
MADTILVIDDDEKIRHLVDISLRNYGYNVLQEADGTAGLQTALNSEVALVVLDINLPDLDGFEVCKAIRKVKEALPVLILSARADEIDRVVGLEIGADDYLIKPFSVPEFLARIKARLKHLKREAPKSSGAGSAGDLLKFGELEIDSRKRKVCLNGDVVALTSKEYDLLHYLAIHPGCPFSREDLLKSIWGLSAQGYENNINGLINRLRKKLEKDQDDPRFLKTVWGVGYRFAEHDEV